MMLGGGNPAHIPEIQALLADRLRALSNDARELRRMLGDYASPAGELQFRQSLATLLRSTYGWPLDADNIALTSGSQSGFFQLFNLLAGQFDDGSTRRILFPLTPEYAGYNDLGISNDMFVARQPSIEQLGGRLFKYHVDFDNLVIDNSIAALCVSRPCNPTGNVLTDAEMQGLGELARAHGVPLIVDSAYGLPFPQIVFRDCEPYWDDNVILTMSLSKLGLPAVRNGIVIARPEIIDALAGMNAVISLAVGSVGAVLMRELVDSGDVIDISRKVIRPYYESRMRAALESVHSSLKGRNYFVHRPEGAFFLWLWLPDLPISSAELYQRLKARDVIVLPGEHFFPGLGEDWPHKRQCLRLSYAQDAAAVERGIAALGEELHALGA